MVLPAIVQPLPLTRLAYERLRESVLSGHMAPGEIYNEMALAKELGVSRTPVREALLELASQGLVTFLPRKGVQVNYFTQRDVEEVFEIRAALELAVVEKIARAHDHLDFRRIDRSLRENARAAERANADAFLRADRDLHAEMAKLAGNDRVVAILSNLRDVIHLMSVEALSKPHRMQEVPAEHAIVVEAMRSGRMEEATEAMRRHMDWSKQAVLERHRAAAGALDQEPAPAKGSKPSPARA